LNIALPDKSKSEKVATMSDEKMCISVLGAGSWGTALSHLLAGKGFAVKLWAYEPEVVKGINEARQNPIYLSDFSLPEGILATGDLKEAVEKTDMVLFVIPAQLVRRYLNEVSKYLPTTVPLVICSKGIERETLATMDQVFMEELPGKFHSNIGILSGPSFATEVVQGMPTNVTLACRDREVARRAQNTIATRVFRVYTTDDLIGVELGGALKNVIAITVGGSDGLGFGNNTRAALITRGLAEITRLAVNLGARPETLLGLAGVGDLVLTCTSDLSRNRLVGKLLAEGRSLQTIQNEMKMVAEGVPTAASAYNLSLKQGIDLPITEQLYKVLYEGKEIPAAMSALQDRALKEEWQQ